MTTLDYDAIKEWEGAGLRFSEMPHDDGLQITHDRWVVTIHNASERIWVTMYTNHGAERCTQESSTSLSCVVILAMGRAPKMPMPLVRALAKIAAPWVEEEQNHQVSSA